MNDRRIAIRDQFRQALRDCKQLYIRAARAALEDQPDSDETARREMIRRMVDLHKGLLVKVYCVIAGADSKWSRAERELAGELVEHLWQQSVEGPRLKEVTVRMFRDSGNLEWYSLVRPFDRICRIRDLVPELDTVVMRLANLVAKADGTVNAREAAAVAGIHAEIDLHLRRIPLEDDRESQAADSQAVDSQAVDSQAVAIVHRENPLLKPSAPASSPCMGREPARASEHDSCEKLTEDLADSLDRALNDLEQLIGLEPVKKEITTLTNFLALQRHRREAGLPAQDLSLHMVYSGNPGTGKTTVARIVGRILKALGFLRKGHLIETDRSGLVAEYAGQTGPRTNRRIDEALDGILFIDEAYSLVASRQNDAYGLEAIQALVKRMEDDRRRLVVILAGYPELMEELLRSNPGLGSRFNTQLVFDDYTPADLGRIFERMCQANHYELPPLTRAKLVLGFDWLYQRRDERFGNGRLVRNTFENSVRRLANRVAAVVPVTRELLTVFTPDDVHLGGIPEETWRAVDDPRMRFALRCDACGQPIRVRVRQLGRRVGCPHCESSGTADWGDPVWPAPKEGAGRNGQTA